MPFLSLFLSPYHLHLQTSPSGLAHRAEPCMSWGDMASCSAVPEKEGEGMQRYLQHHPDSTCAPSLWGSRAVMWLRVAGQPWSLLAEMPLPNPALPLKTCPRTSPRRTHTHTHISKDCVQSLQILCKVTLCDKGQQHFNIRH